MGPVPGEDGYGLYNTASYFGLFSVIATHLRSTRQLWRLLGAISAAGLTAASIGVLEYYGFGPLGFADGRQGRTESTFGNPIFFGSFLVMTIPVSLAVARSVGSSLMIVARVAGWAAVIGVQLLALALTLSEGRGLD